MRFLSLFLVFAICFFCLACSDSKTLSPPEVKDSETEDDTDSESESEDDSDSGESEIPPELPADCVGEEGGMNVIFNDDGDSEKPTAAAGDGNLVAWANDLGEGEYPEWHMRLAVYDPMVTEITHTAPMADTVLAEKPSMAYGNDSFGMVWLDSQWDLSCEPALLESCRRDVAFMSFDETGVPANAIPRQLTIVDTIEARPDIVATTNGWLVVWQEQVGSNDGTVRAMSIATDGTLGTAFDVSESGGSDTGSRARIASLGDTAVVVWLVDDQQGVGARKLNQDGTTEGDVIVIDEGNHTAQPAIVAGSGEYLVSMGRKVSDDFEIYTVLLDEDGSPSGAASRATWTTTDVLSSAVAWNGSQYAMAWLSDRDNGATAAWDTDGDPQVFMALLDSFGAPSTSAVMISEDPNPASALSFIWDGGGWTVFWELPGAGKKRIFRGRAICGG